MKQGVDDFLAAGNSIDDLIALATNDLRVPPGEASTPEERSASGLPRIQVNERFLRDIAADSIEALEAANDPPVLFMRGTTLVRVASGARIEVLSSTALKGILDRRADFVTIRTKIDKASGEPGQEVKPARPPSDLAPDILTTPGLPFPELAGITTVPVFLPDGTLLASNGYDPESHLLLRLDGLDAVSADMIVAEAVKLVFDDLLIDFPFAGSGSRVHALCLLLQPFVRNLIQGPTPLYGIDAPTRGTGKGLLTAVVSYIVTGNPAPVMALPRDHDELEKRITAALLEAESFVMLDNVVSLRSPALAAALTSEEWRGRRLGQSEIIKVPNTTTWVATGNNIELSDEIARRTVPIRLDARLERPEERKGFRHPLLLEWVRQNRSRFVSACLSIIQHWVNLGMPEGTRALGSYESWSRVMGGIMESAGITGFLEGRDSVYKEADRETQEWMAVCAAWYQQHRTLAVIAKDVLDICKERNLLLDLWGGRQSLGALQRIGHALAGRRERVYGRYRIMSAGRDSTTGNASYRLEPLPIETPETPRTLPTFATTSGVSGVSGVFPRPPEPDNSERDAQSLEHLVGATRGEL